MSRRLHRTVPALVVLLGLGLAGCSDDDPDTEQTQAATSQPVPSTDGSSSATTEAGPCSVVTDARLSELTGRPQTVGEATTVGRRVECRTVREPDDALTVSWGFEELQVEDPTSVVDSEGFGLEQGSVDLEGAAAPGILLTGEDAGAPTVKVVVVVGDQVLVTEATDEEAAVGGEGTTVDVLRRVAVGIAEDYLAAGIPATSAG